ncbi:hypothetical protein VNO77_05811 [Canavalia gladiata]|uniref:Uncharacterized protein n=1 Tax=Canavalia gladiata TaxID=3824 RepID=A0AAN9MZS4_CANGL
MYKYKRLEMKEGFIHSPLECYRKREGMKEGRKIIKEQNHTFLLHFSARCIFIISLFALGTLCSWNSAIKKSIERNGEVGGVVMQICNAERTHGNRIESENPSSSVPLIPNLFL